MFLRPSTETFIKRYPCNLSMLRSTFSFLPGIDEKTEENIRLQGIRTWNDFLNARFLKGLSPKRKYYYDRALKDASQALLQGNSSFFSDKLCMDEHWKLYGNFSDETAFLDIETTGLSSSDQPTVVGIYDGFQTKTMVKGINLDAPKLKETLSNYKYLVSFNGSVFDIPFLERCYPGSIPKLPHLDLRFACKKIGLTGGLKEIEKKLGISRENPIVQRMHGGDAVTLWRMYRATGDDHYLNLLIEYNEEDIVNLKRIADIVYSELSFVK